MVDNDVDVYWQENAWANMEILAWLVNRILACAPAVAHLDEFVFFYKNLKAQVSLLLEAVRNINGIILHGIANATDLWQQTHAGAGILLSARKDGRNWAEEMVLLENEENTKKWLGNSEEKLSAK